MHFRSNFVAISAEFFADFREMPKVVAIIILRYFSISIQISNEYFHDDYTIGPNFSHFKFTVSHGRIDAVATLAQDSRRYQLFAERLCRLFDRT